MIYINLQKGLLYLKKKHISILFLIFLISVSITSTLLTISTHILSLNENSLYLNLSQNDYSSLNYIHKKIKGDSHIQSFSPNEVDKLQNQLNLKLSKCYSIYKNSKLIIPINSLNLNIPDIRDLPYYYIPAAHKFNYSEIVEIQSPEDLPYKDLIGKFPENTEQVIITSLLADYIINFSSNIKTYQDLLKIPNFITVTNSKKLQICGIVKFPLDRFKNLKNEKPSPKSFVGDDKYLFKKDQNNAESYENFFKISYKYQNLFCLQGFAKSIEQNNDIIISSVYTNQINHDVENKILKINSISSDGVYVAKPFSNKFIGQIHAIKKLSLLSFKTSLVIFIFTIILGTIIIRKVKLTPKIFIKAFFLTFLTTFLQLFFATKILVKNFSYVSPSYSLPLNITFLQIVLIFIFTFLCLAPLLKPIKIRRFSKKNDPPFK